MLPCLAVVNNAAINVWMHMSFQISVLNFLDEYPEVELLGAPLSLIVVFVLQCMLSDVSIATPAFLFACFHFHAICFPSFTFSLCVFQSSVSLLQTACVRVLFSYPFCHLISFDWSI